MCIMCVKYIYTHIFESMCIHTHDIGCGKILRNSNYVKDILVFIVLSFKIS